MYITAKNDFEAFRKLRWLADNVGLGNVVVASCSFRDAKHLAWELASAHPDSFMLNDFGKVTLRVRDTTFHFVGVKDGSKVRGISRGKCLLVVTDRMPQEVVDRLLMSEEAQANPPQEVFVPAETAEDIARDEAAAALKSDRVKFVEEHGVVPEAAFPDNQKCIKETRQSSPCEVVVSCREAVVSCEVFDFKFAKRGMEAYILLDGNPVRGVTRVVVDCRVNHYPTVTLEVLPLFPTEAVGSEGKK